jgi:ketosteroid isomerase-like protein
MGTAKCRAWAVAAVVVTALLATCATTGGSVADEAALREAGDLYVKAVNSGDVDLYMDRWDAEGIRMTPDGPSVFGAAEIRKVVARGFPTATREMTLTTEEVVVFGDIGYARGVYTTRVTPKGGGAPSFVDGKFLTVYRRQADGSWKIYRDCYNSNVPPAK